jgi:hypothetical protein
MWQIYGLMALDLIKERRREADAERRARQAQRHVVRGSVEARVEADETIRQAVLSTHRG